MDGSQEERNLMAVLRGHGFIPLRAPGSGTGDWDLPDVLAAQQGILVATELKSGARPRNLDREEVEALQRVADAFWAASLVGVRYKGDRTFYFADPARLDRTDSGKFSLPGDPERLDWSVALPWTRDDGGGVVPLTTDSGEPQVIYATEETAPGLPEWLDALTAQQQGFQVRHGVLDLRDDEDASAAAQPGDDDD